MADLSGVIADFAQHVDTRFNALEARQDELDHKYQHLLDTIDGFIGRID